MWNIIKEMYIQHLLVKSILEKGAIYDFEKIQQRAISIHEQADRDLAKFQY